MLSDEQLQSDVLEALRLEPAVDGSQIGVTAKDGVVTLSGFVPGYGQKWTAERVAKRVYGVRAVADDVEVRLGEQAQRTDAEVAKAALDALKWNSMVPDEKIKVIVEKGWVRLEGKADWRYQRDAAERAVRFLTGVKGVTNSIEVEARAKVTPSEVKHRIFEAFRRSADLDARRVGVDVKDGKVVLHGNVGSWAEADAAQDAAWAIPGVSRVENNLHVVP